MCKQYVSCGYCGKQVNVSRFLFPGWHICAYTEQERNEIDRKRLETRKAFQETVLSGSPYLGNLGGAFGNYEDWPKQQG